MTTSKHAHILTTILILVFLNLSVSSQTLYTFSNSIVENTVYGAASANLTKDVIVSGVPAGSVLRQVNISFGDGSTDYNGDMLKLTLRLKNPSSTTITLLSTGSTNSYPVIAFANTAIKSFNIHLRDYTGLRTIREQIATTSSTAQDGSPFNFGYYRSENSFTGLNTANVNGTWQFLITNGYSGSTTSAKTRKFNKIELIFGPPIPIPTDLRGAGTAKPNESCATKSCIQTGNPYLGKDTGYGSQSTPGGTIGGCTWNSDNNNKSWFYFIASATTAEISISGLSTRQQSVVVKPSSNNCATSSYSLVAGGCMSTMFGTTNKQVQYYNAGYTAGNGSSWNHGYNLSGLTIGSRYILIVEGETNTNSEFYIDLSSGASNGCSPLPISLLDFSGEIQDNKIELNWTTLSERENDYYTIYRSQDAVNWEEIAQMDGAGNASDTRYYTSIDQNPLPGISYYKLKQTDFNGDFEEFDPISIAFEGKTNELYVFPNPSSTGFNLRIELNEIEEGLFNIQDLNGKIILEETHKLSIGDNLISLEGKTLIPGVYILHSKIGTKSLKPVKLIVK